MFNPALIRHPKGKSCTQTQCVKVQSKLSKKFASVMSARLLYVLCVFAAVCCYISEARIRSLKPDPNVKRPFSRLEMHATEHTLKEDVLPQLLNRAKRQSGRAPVVHGSYTFTSDTHRYASIHYSGEKSPVIIVLTYDLNLRRQPTSTTLYRSTNYGASFSLVTVDTGDRGIVFWPNFYVSDTNKNMIVFAHATLNRIYYSLDEGEHWTVRDFTPSTISANSLTWNPVHDQWALALDSTNNVLYVTTDIGSTWKKISENVGFASDYQWGDPKYDDPSTVFYNTYDPEDLDRDSAGPNQDFTAHLSYTVYPYTSSQEFDPTLGRHDDFLLLGPYIFAQKSNSGVVQLYISFNRTAFNRSRIPSNDAHENYIVAHINELQALVVVDHVSGQNNLYLSDITGVYFSLSLPDIVTGDSGLDLERTQGINGTLIANQFVRADPSVNDAPRRTVITLDNGGIWGVVTPPSDRIDGTSSDCVPPACSLHFHMDNSDYARLGVYSEESAPGIIIAHGNLGTEVSTDPDLYISRDGGVTWAETLQSSWGVVMADNGGLLVAAKDYHQEPSSVLMYSCNEGKSWQSFTFSSTDMFIFGVLTEPGEFTTTVSLYGTQSSIFAWDVVTVNFSSIYTSTCTTTDYYGWQPWDSRTDTDCILGSDVTIERRIVDRCCLIGTDYSRAIGFHPCLCSSEDFECDYGYMRSDGLTGPCVPDPASPLLDPCADGTQKTYLKSQGYRKIPGDVCVNGVEDDFAPYYFTCCNNSIHVLPPEPVGSSGNHVAAIVLGVALVGVIIAAVVMGIIAAVFIWKHSSLNRRYLQLASTGSEGRRIVSRQSSSGARSSSDAQPLVANIGHSKDNEEDDDDDPLAL